MSKVNLNLDMADVKVAVQDAIKPAVEAALSSYDVKAAIANLLKQPLPADDYFQHRLMSEMYYQLAYTEGRSKKGKKNQPTLLDWYVRQGVQEIAKQYVFAELKEQRPLIEKGLQKMLASSTSKLTRAFTDAATSAFEDKDWSFTFTADVGHKVRETERDYD